MKPTAERLVALLLSLVLLLLWGCARTTTTPSPPASEATSTETTSTGVSPTPTSTTLPDTTTWPAILLVQRWSGLDQPLYVDHAGDERIFVVEKTGRIRLIKDGVLLDRPFLDISRNVSNGSEQGLLSVAFPPDFGKKKHFYVNYTDSNGDTRIARFRLGSEDVADPGTEQTVLKINQPFANHNGGQLQFGPDGFLYIGMGDGGSEGDPQKNGQNHATLLSKLLRIDVESGKFPYSVPADNPFLGNDSFAPEGWAYGLRNPWRFSFDRKTGDMYIADVGQDLWEEVDFQPAGKGGQDYGWSLYEADHPYPPGTTPAPTKGLTFPVAEYSHAVGNSITGGYAYRGSRFPTMAGVYFFGDFGSGRIWGMRRINGHWEYRQLAHTNLGISSFGEDEAANLYVCDLNGGTVSEIRAR